MAATDKKHEFYTCLDRFSFLSECYPPEDIGNEDPALSDAFVLIQQYANRKEIRKRIEEASDWFEDSHKILIKSRRREVIDHLMRSEE